MCNHCHHPHCHLHVRVFDWAAKKPLYGWYPWSFLHLLTNQVFPDHELAMVLIGTIKGNGSGVSALTIIIIIIAIIIIVITIVIIIPLILMIVKR